MKKPVKKMKPVRAWGGFVDGRLDWTEMDTGWGGYGNAVEPIPAAFRTRKSARKKYQDVRRVEIREIPS
jgi:hypothetical protein